MLRINISEFAHYSSEAIEEFLLVSGDIDFEIKMPKRSSAMMHEKFFVVYEYAAAAYGGQLLSRLSDTFSYSVPNVLNKGAFNFQLSTTRYRAFANVLHYIIQGFTDHDRGEAFRDYQTKATQFFYNAYDKDAECNTWGLVAVAEKFLES